MATLIERLRAAREEWVTVGEYQFLVRRPTPVQLARWRDEKDVPFLGRVVVGWKGVRELDLVPGGDGSEAAFDPALLVEWIEDRPQMFTVLMGEVQRVIAAHFAKLEADAGK